MQVNDVRLILGYYPSKVYTAKASRELDFFTPWVESGQEHIWQIVQVPDLFERSRSTEGAAIIGRLALQIHNRVKAFGQLCLMKCESGLTCPANKICRAKMENTHIYACRVYSLKCPPIISMNFSLARIRGVHTINGRVSIVWINIRLSRKDCRKQVFNISHSKAVLGLKHL